MLFFWLNGAAPSKIDEYIVNEYLAEYRSLLRKLREQGTLIFLDITLPGAPGYSIICIFSGEKSHLIKFCPGLSYDISAKSSIIKSFLEMWQNYGFFLRSERSEELHRKISDDYQKNFFYSNNENIFRDFTEGTISGIYPTRSIANKFPRDSTNNFLKEKTEHLYLYLASAQHCGQPIFFCKMFSPDFFMNLDTSRNCNVDNIISNEYSGNFLSSRLNKMVPFP